ncbi:uncharacterized protein LOC118433898 isoform X1 [Folsomia candida]|uniref:uncharacterized protein LOC118433898 isoform X1 n=1 Tax=Folsomia candida TaxID=158441 RepID=UPI0016052129|nr:uncharacterized protein LOC118433898 isoform X1 [Folsomia candida]
MLNHPCFRVTQVPLYQSVTMGYSDELTKWFPSNTNSEQILNFALTAWSFVFSLICCTRGGIWVYKFMKIYSGGVSLVLSVFAELLVVSWIWGLEDLCNAAEAMTGRKPGLFLRLCWKIFSPLSLMGIASLLYIDITKSEMKYNGEIAPKSVHVAGNILTCIPLIIIPIYVIYQLFYSKADTFALVSLKIKLGLESLEHCIFVFLSQKMRLLFYPENEHHDIRRGRFPTERYTSGHIFYIGWNVVCRKKRTTKPKIHPADPAIIVTETSKSLFDTQKIDSNENTNDNPGTDTDKSKSEPPVQDKFETVEVPVTEKKITSKHVSNKQPRPSTDPGSEIVPENNGENPIKVSRKSGTIKKKPKSHPR